MAVQQASVTLVQAAKKGDESAFELLLEPLLDQGYRLACAMLHDRSAAEDAVEDASFKAWQKVGQLEDHLQRPRHGFRDLGRGPDLATIELDLAESPKRQFPPNLAARLHERAVGVAVRAEDTVE